MNTDEYKNNLKVKTKKVLAIDFDGVIHKNSKGFYDGTVYDEPIDGARDALNFLSKKYKLIIFTCKAKPERPLINRKTGIELIWEWLKKYNLDGCISDVTHEKPHAYKYIDDKALTFFDWETMLDLL